MNGDVIKGAIFSEIRNFLAKAKMDYNTEFQVVFLTSVGKIVCDIGDQAGEGALIGLSDDPTTIDVDISAIFDDKCEFDTHLVNAKNVVVYKNNSNDVFMQADQMVLFTDQILGVSLEKKA